MQTFLNLPPRKSIGIDTSIYKNALQLKKDAFHLAEYRKSYNSATSLLILSSEEVIKATLVLLHSKGCEVYKIEGAKRFFTNHKIRHQIAQLIEMGAGFIDSLKKWEEVQEKEKFINTKYKLLNTIVNGFMDFAEAIQPFSTSIERIEFIEKFDDMKNQGLYVDYKDGLINPKDSIDKELYIKTKELSNRISRFYKGIKIIYHPSLKNHLSEKEIKKYQSDLKSFVNDVLIDFSFDSLNK